MYLNECNVGDTVSFYSTEHNNILITGKIIIGEGTYPNRILVGWGYFENREVGWEAKNTDYEVRKVMELAGVGRGWWVIKGTTVLSVIPSTPLTDGWYRCKCGGTTSNKNKICCGCKQ